MQVRISKEYLTLLLLHAPTVTSVSHISLSQIDRINLGPRYGICSEILVYGRFAESDSQGINKHCATDSRHTDPGASTLLLLPTFTL